MSEYKIIFKGEITNESNRPKIELALAKFFKIPSEKASNLFNGKSYALKKGLTLNSAEQMQTKFKSIGVITHLIKEDRVVEGISSQESVEVEKNNQQEINTNNAVCLDCGSKNLGHQGGSIDKASPNKWSIDKLRIVKFNWYAFFFNTFYFAGFGQIKPAMYMLFTHVFLSEVLPLNVMYIPLLIIGTYAAYLADGVNFQRTQKFSWFKAGVILFSMIVLKILMVLAVEMLFGSYVGDDW